MGNILGKPQTFYITYDDKHRSSSSAAAGPYYYYYYYTTEVDDNCNYYCWPQDFTGLFFCCPWCGGGFGYQYDTAEAEAGVGWDAGVYADAGADVSAGAGVVGVVRRKGCKDRNHWALAFQDDIDVSQLPRRIDGFRTRIPERCRRECGPRRVYVVAEDSSSSSSGSSSNDGDEDKDDPSAAVTDDGSSVEEVVVVNRY